MLLFLDIISSIPEFCVIDDNKIILQQKITQSETDKLSDNIIQSYIEIGKRLYNNTNMLSNLDTFSKFDSSETYPIYIHKKNESMRDSLRDVSMKPSVKKFAKRTIKNRKRHKRKY